MLARLAPTARDRVHPCTELLLRRSPDFQPCLAALAEGETSSGRTLDGVRLASIATLPNSGKECPYDCTETVISRRGAPPCSGVVGRVQGYGSDV